MHAQVLAFFAPSGSSLLDIFMISKRRWARGEGRGCWSLHTPPFWGKASCLTMLACCKPGLLGLGRRAGVSNEMSISAPAVATSDGGTRGEDR